MNMEYNFSEDLKSIREILGFSQGELAEKIGVGDDLKNRAEKNRTIGKAFGSSIFVCI